MQYPEMLFWEEEAVKVDGGFLTVAVFGLREKSGIQFQVDFRREGDIDFFAQEIRAKHSAGNAPTTGAMLAVNGGKLRDAWVVLLRFAADVLAKQGDATIARNKRTNEIKDGHF